MKKILNNELLRRLDYPSERSAFVNTNAHVSLDPGFRELMSDIVKNDEKRRDVFKVKKVIKK